MISAVIVYLIAVFGLIGLFCWVEMIEIDLNGKPKKKKQTQWEKMNEGLDDIGKRG